MKRAILSILVAVSFLLSCSTGLLLESAHAGEYQALKGVKSVKAIFDFRDGEPASALVHLKLIHDTFKDQALRSISAKPDFVVVFMGPSVTLLSKKRDNFSAEDKKGLEEFDSTVAAMAKDGVRLEVCLFAAHVFAVDPKTIAPEITQVDNGWIASLGYQQNGYSLVPVF